MTSVELTGTSFSSRSIPIGTESEIDIAQLSFTTPIYINMPAKVKKLVIITNVIMSIFDESNGNVELGITTPQLKAYSDSPAERAAMYKQTDRINRDSLNLSVTTATYKDYGLVVMNNIAQLIDRGKTGTVTWTCLLYTSPSPRD